MHLVVERLLWACLLAGQPRLLVEPAAAPLAQAPFRPVLVRLDRPRQRWQHLSELSPLSVIQRLRNLLLDRLSQPRPRQPLVVEQQLPLVGVSHLRRHRLDKQPRLPLRLGKLLRHHHHLDNPPRRHRRVVKWLLRHPHLVHRLLIPPHSVKLLLRHRHSVKPLHLVVAAAATAQQEVQMDENFANFLLRANACTAPIVGSLTSNLKAVRILAQE